ncbi:MAG: sulfotransferase family protein [Bacteroidetes bacterium]|nr:sulfotransferase family protein [Bacteroidota bacterium]
MKILHLLSGPRNISTALMYSFAQRKDTKIIDEPFYGYYLNLSGADHPGRNDVLASQPLQQNEIIESLLNDPTEKALLFVKNMAHHLDAVPLHFLDQLQNIILIRDPQQILASYNEVIKNPMLSDIGLKRQYEIFRYLSDQKNPPVVIDSSEVLSNPKNALSLLCSRLSIPFDASMLQWQAGPRPEDGVWAKYWYANVHRSTGFEKHSISQRNLPKQLYSVYSEALPYYEELKKFALKS